MVVFAIMAFFYQYVTHERDYEMANDDASLVATANDPPVEQEQQQPPPATPSDDSPM